ncbi:MAG: hypothetical protein KGL39_40915 [Patescibacteria group bacterium]|nr:hypothetical protein [Patescibacteria group bacterium]
MSLLLNNAMLVLGGNNLSGIMNAVALSYKAVALENTRFGANTKNMLGGLKEVSVSAKGYWDSAYDAALFSDVGNGDIITAAAQGGTEGNVAYFLQVLAAEYQTGTKVGENLPFSLTADAQGNLIRGLIAANRTGITASGTGTGFNLGAVASGQSLWAALHVLSATGTTPSLEMVIQGASSNTFSAPTSVLTFAPMAVPGALFASVAGPLAETWYRGDWTITGTTPDFAFLLAMGIQ